MNPLSLRDRWRFRRPAGASLFLAGAVLVLVAVAVQTSHAIASERRLHEKLLRDNARIAGWNVDQFLAAELATVVECALHGTHHVRIGERIGHVPTAADVLAEWSVGCGEAPAPAVRTLHRFGPGDAYERAGAPVAPDLVTELRAVLTRERAASVSEEPVRPPARRTEYAVAATLAGAPHLVLYSRQLVPGGVAVYAAALDSAAVARVVDRVLARHPLLPEPVLPRAATARGVGLRLRLPGGAVLFDRPAAEGVTALTAATELRPALGGLVADVELSTAAAALLAPGGLPRGRALSLAGSVALSLLLVGLGYRQLRRERELARIRSDFVASVSHELRTPLALQRIYLDMIRLGRIPDQAERGRALESIDRESLRLQHIVENVLQFSRGERDQLRLAPAARELGDVVAASLAAFRPLADQAGVRIETSLEDAVRGRIDEAAFHRALANVLENAVKYGPEGQTVRVAVLRTRDGQAVVRVDDEGPGIPPAERELVLRPFHRGSTAGASGGSGIGLAVVRQVVTMHGGEVRLSDAPGGGARVELTLPLETASAGPAEGSGEAAVPGAGPAGAATATEASP